MKETDRVKGLEKGLKLLVMLSQHNRALSLEELTKAIGYSRTACFRLLQTMKGLGFVEQDLASKGYRLGTRNISIGAAALSNLNLRQIARPFMESLKKETDETVNLAILDGVEIVFIERIEARFIISSQLRVGDRLPAHWTSQGKAIMAFLPEARLEHVLAQIRFEKRAAKTITSVARLRDEIEKVRTTGIALSDEEIEIGLSAVAVPIRDLTGQAVAAMNVSFPLFRHSLEEGIRVFSPLLKKACREISALLGFEEREGPR